MRSHLVAILLGLATFLLFQRIDYQALKRLIPLFTVLLLLLLALVFLPSVGIFYNGANRWVRLGPITLQPSEFARFIMVAFFALYVVRRHEFSSAWKNHRFVIPAMVLAMMSFLILMEPNYGMFVTLVVLFLVLLFVVGMPLRTFIGVLALCAIVLTALLVSSEYRMARLVAFLDPHAHFLRSGYQVIQSLVGITNGGLWGTGIGAGRQKLLYLPQMHTDFISAVVGEEAGFVGLSLLATLYLGVFFLCMRVASRSRDAFGRLFTFGVGVSVVLNAFFHMGITLNLLPPTGMVLPFISYGRSSIVAHLMAMAMVYKISVQSEESER